MKVLVTGSNGQVGTNLCLTLMEKGITVLGLDKRENVWTDAYPYVLHDLLKGMPGLARLDEKLPGFGLPDIVVHLAANAKVHELVLNPKRAHDNGTITFNVLEFCRRHRLPLVFSSSREVYGHSGPPTVPEEAVDAFDILSPYAAYKLADEMLVYSYAHCYGLKYIIFRLSNVYGRYDSDIGRMSRVLHIFINQMRRGDPITIFDRSKVIDFTYVDDCVAGLVLGIEKLHRGEVANATMNLSSGSPATLLQLAETIATKLNVTPEIIDKPIQPGEISFYVADLSKARVLLGYEPKIPFKEGIERAIEWVLDWEKNHGHKHG